MIEGAEDWGAAERAAARAEYTDEQVEGLCLACPAGEACLRCASGMTSWVSSWITCEIDVRTMVMTEAEHSTVRLKCWDCGHRWTRVERRLSAADFEAVARDAGLRG